MIHDPNGSCQALRKLRGLHQLTTDFVVKRKRKHLCEKVIDVKKPVAGSARSFSWPRMYGNGSWKQDARLFLRRLLASWMHQATTCCFCLYHPRLEQLRNVGMSKILGRDTVCKIFGWCIQSVIYGLYGIWRSLQALFITSIVEGEKK